MAQGFRFPFGGRGRGGFGSRFGHHRFHPHVFPYGPHQDAPVSDTSDIEDTENSMLEIVKQISRKEYFQGCSPGHCKKDKKQMHHHSKQVHKNSVDPVWTIVENKDGKFTICIVLGKEAKPEDVKLNMKERDIYIEIKIEKRSEDGTSQLSQVFTKKVALPAEVKVEDVKSHLTPEGILKIEASVPVPEEISIPVSVNTDNEPTSPLAEN